MGLLLLISPPGYGKTTLMEYVANRLGLVFMKVNGPALGHEVTSIDPKDAPNATAAMEVEKVNLALEMGNNVMLYLDDIQHTNPEFLQKFISLCDAQRRIEGVWRGKTRTYDLRGKKFCVVMAGNPYTESGAAFKIPDMLANRADTYNLGDILGGQAEAFALSYVENTLTSNRSLAPLATREQADVYRFARMAKGEEVQATEFSYGYSGAEVQEILAVLKHLFRVQETLLKVNAQYIASAAMDDMYRTEPPFKLQGQLPQHEQDGGEGGGGDDHRGARPPGRRPLPGRGADADDRGGAEPAQAGRDARALTPEQARAVGDDQEGVRAGAQPGRRRGRSGGAGQRAAVAPGRAHRGHQHGGQGGGRAVGEPRVAARPAPDAAADADGRAAGVRAAAAAAGGAASRSRRSRGPVAPLVPSGPSIEWAKPQIARIAAALEGLNSATLAVQIQNEPPPGITELLAQQVAIIERTLVPLVRAATGNLQDVRSLEMRVDEMLGMLQEIDEKMKSKTAR
jgi:hypothetical protein